MTIYAKHVTPPATFGNGNAQAITQTLMSTYDEMRTRQRKAIIEQKCMRSDPYFESNPARLDDDRRCLAISCVMNDENLAAGGNCVWTDAYWKLQNRLKGLCAGIGDTDISQENDSQPGEHMRFGQSVQLEGGICGQLHFTLMQLVGFPDYNAEMRDDSIYASSQYMDCVQDALIVGGMDAEVQIRFIGCIAVATGLLMVGIPDSLNINGARDCVRERLKKRGFPLKEPFVNDIVHSTLFRVTKNQKTAADPILHTKILDLSKEFENVHLGTVTMRNFQIGPASWRMLPSELAATPPWRKWTLPNRSTQQEYRSGVIVSPEKRNCFTVSGASGANLAREIRRVLSGLPTNDDGEESKKPENAIIDMVMQNAIFCSSKRITEERAEEDNNMTLTKGVGQLHNFKIDTLNSESYEDSSYVGPICLRTELNGKLEDDAKNDIAKSAVTVSGASGVLLAQELQKRLEVEKQRLVSVYQTDFF